MFVTNVTFRFVTRCTQVERTCRTVVRVHHLRIRLLKKEVCIILIALKTRFSSSPGYSNEVQKSFEIGQDLAIL